MRVVPVFGLVLHVRDVDRDTALLLLGRIVDRVKRPKFRSAFKLAVFRDRRCQRRLPVVDVSHRPYVQMRLCPLKFLLRHE